MGEGTEGVGRLKMGGGGGKGGKMEMEMERGIDVRGHILWRIGPYERTLAFACLCQLDGHFLHRLRAVPSIIPHRTLYVSSYSGSKISASVSICIFRFVVRYP